AGIGIALPLIAFVAFVGYKRVTMPYPLKIINRALKVLQKGGEMNVEGIKIASRDAQVRKLLAPEFESLGLEEETEPSDSDEEPLADKDEE
ncbi:MAG: hypothetical protein ACW976_06000, partial [Candidatus Ranarchaeia archaeon]